MIPVLDLPPSYDQVTSPVSPGPPAFSATVPHHHTTVTVTSPTRVD